MLNTNIFCCVILSFIIRISKINSMYLLVFLTPPVVFVVYCMNPWCNQEGSAVLG